MSALEGDGIYRNEGMVMTGSPTLTSHQVKNKLFTDKPKTPWSEVDPPLDPDPKGF